MSRALDRSAEAERWLGDSPVMSRVLEQIRHLAPTRSTALIVGEPGTERSLVARAIHERSTRHGGPFLEVSAGALPESVLIPEMLGVESAAGSGGNPGLFELADSGTLFLDRIDEIPASIQAHLLQVLTDREVVRHGSTKRRRVDLRVLAGAEHELSAEASATRIRADLFQRLSVVVIRLPSLHERARDIPRLADLLLRDLGRERHRRLTLTRGVLERLMRHPWPGNVRELRATLETMIVMARGKRTLDLSDLPPDWGSSDPPAREIRLKVGMTLEETERRLIEATLKETGFDKPRAAALLGIGLRTLYRKIERYGIS